MTEIRAGSPKVPRRRLAIYSQDSLGLGHLRRTTLIGGAFLGADTDSNVLLFADSPVAPFFELPNGMDVVKLPSIRKVSAGCWEATRLRVDDRELIRFRADLLRSGLLNFRPDVLLVDHMPGGAQRELIPALEALKRAVPECLVVLGIRDILDAEDVIKRVWESEGAYEALDRYYGRLLIYGSKELFDTGGPHRLPALSHGTHSCGYVVHPRSGPSAEQRMRAELFAATHLVDMLDPNDLSPETLAERLIADLERNDYPAGGDAVPMDGARHAADRLMEAVDRLVQVARDVVDAVRKGTYARPA